MNNTFLPIRWFLSSKYRQLFLRAMGRNYRVAIGDHPQLQQALMDGWLMLPEVIYGDEIEHGIAYARRYGLRVAAIFHDAIPVSHPHLVSAEAARCHADYMRAISLADMVLAVSSDAAQAYVDFASQNNLQNPKLVVCPAPAEILDTSRALNSEETQHNQVCALCVSTLEPRKNHRLLIEAFEDVCALRPDLDLYLDLVGDAYAGAPQIAKFVSDAAERNPRIRWHGRVEQAQLRDLYYQSSFTIYPSCLEGFGLPVMESLWLGKPCICANVAPMAENAAGGGCLMLDVRDRKTLSDGILTLATQPELRHSLAMQATQRKLKTWKEYAMDIRDTFATFRASTISIPFISQDTFAEIPSP